MELAHNDICFFVDSKSKFYKNILISKTSFEEIQRNEVEKKSIKSKYLCQTFHLLASFLILSFNFCSSESTIDDIEARTFCVDWDDCADCEDCEDRDAWDDWEDWQELVCSLLEEVFLSPPIDSPEDFADNRNSKARDESNSRFKFLICFYRFPKTF